MGVHFIAALRRAGANLVRARLTVLVLAVAGASLWTAVGAVLRPSLGALLVGSAIVALVSDGVRAATLQRLRNGESLLLSLRTVPPMITVRAVEWTVYFTLLESAVVVAMHLNLRATLTTAAALALVLAPVVYVCALTFGVARLAIVRIADGMLPAAAWVEGVRLVLSRPVRFIAIGAVLGGLGFCLACVAILTGVEDAPLTIRFLRNFLLLVWALAGYAVLQAAVQLIDEEETT